MNKQETSIDDLYSLILIDGLPVESGGQTLCYRQVRLRETTVADERAAQRVAERVVTVQGQHRLLVSDADFRYALTLRHVDWLECDGMKLQGAVLDLDVFGKLSSHDLGLIEQRVLLITLAAEVRYGNMTQAEFEDILTEHNSQEKAPSPPPVGQVTGMGTVDSQPELGPALLATYVGTSTDSTA